MQLRSLPMIGCPAAQRRLSGYIEDELAEDERRFVNLHLRRCARCRKMLRTLRAVIESLGQLADADQASVEIAAAFERLRPEG
jgi:anti-sigma factor RsiW